MTEIEVSVTQGNVRGIAVPVTAADLTLLTGDGWCCGWALREASGDTGAYNEGAVAAPAAGATIVAVTGLLAGSYVASVVLTLAGPAAAADANNFQAVPSSGATLNLVNPGAAGEYPQEEFIITVGASGSLTIKAIGAGTAGVTYSATVALSPSGPVQVVAEIQDGNQPIGEVSIPINGVDKAWFGEDGVRMMNQIKLHMIQGTVTGVIYARFNDLTG